MRCIRSFLRLSFSLSCHSQIKNSHLLKLGHRKKVNVPTSLFTDRTQQSEPVLHFSSSYPKQRQTRPTSSHNSCTIPKILRGSPVGYLPLRILAVKSALVGNKVFSGNSTGKVLGLQTTVLVLAPPKLVCRVLFGFLFW